MSCYDLSFYVVTKRYTRPFRYSTISDPPSFELPYTLSTNVIGTCTHVKLTKVSYEVNNEEGGTLKQGNCIKNSKPCEDVANTIKRNRKAELLKYI